MLLWIKFFGTLIIVNLVLCLPSVLATQNETNSPAAVPTNLEECFAALKKELTAEQISAMKAKTESDMIEYHFSLGMWMRNQWGLWGNGPLAKYFEKMGLHHPDDMSGVILTTFWRHLNQKPLNVSAEVAHYQAHWFKEAKNGCESREDGSACAQLGQLYQLGEGVPIDKSLTLKYFSKACQFESPEGCLAYAEALATDSKDGNGKRIKQLKQKGVELMAQECETYTNWYCFPAAQEYEKGENVGKDFSRALRYYTLACEDKHEKACEAVKRLRR
ncbi:MAG: sel1 repeat family protein [Acidobacteria bacterium]|nr:sel1 repeat family protein [Acidobacteriota bacterium]